MTRRRSGNATSSRLHPRSRRRRRRDRCHRAPELSLATISSLLLLLAVAVASYCPVQRPKHLGASPSLSTCRPRSMIPRSAAGRGKVENNDENVKKKVGARRSTRGRDVASRPTPAMPSQLFLQLAQSQLELLASSLKLEHDGSSGTSKIKSMALYLPQENAKTGQLEFLPAVLHPHPDQDRVFIASDATSKLAPALPRTLTKLPGFAVASSLLPTYPMVSSSDEVGVGVVEEVFCNVQGNPKRRGVGGGGRGAALSIPLFSGSQTVGVLLVSPSDDLGSRNNLEGSVWTDHDRQQVARAAKSLSLALSMDTERVALQRQNQAVKEALSDSLHQLKNPLQALRTYGKLLQQRIADSESTSPMQPSSDDASTTPPNRRGTTPQLLELADHLLIQSDRVSQKLKPVDWIVDRMDEPPPPRPPLLLLRPAEERSLVRWTPQSTAVDDNVSSWAAREATSAIVPTGQVVSPKASRQSSTRQADSKLLSAGQGATNADTDNFWDAQGRPTSHLFDSQHDDLEMSFLEDVLEPVVSAFRAIATDRSIDFAVEVTDDVPGVTVSAHAIQEVMSNLLDNAFKYVNLVVNNDDTNDNQRNVSRGRKRQQPRVRLRITSNPPGIPPGATLLVEDNGPGILESDLEAIFSRGYRGSQSSGVTQGSGLGLDIARSLVRKMGGTIRALTPREAAKRGCRLSGAVVEVVLYRNPATLAPPL